MVPSKFVCSDICQVYSMRSVAMPAATGAAVEVPSLRSWRGSFTSLMVETLAPRTATPNVMYFSTPDLYDINSLRLPFPSTAPIQITTGRLAGNVMGSFAPSFDAEAMMRILALCALISARSIAGIGRLNPQEIEIISAELCIAHSMA